MYLYINTNLGVLAIKNQYNTIITLYIVIYYLLIINLYIISIIYIYIYSNYIDILLILSLNLLTNILYLYIYTQ